MKKESDKKETSPLIQNSFWKAAANMEGGFNIDLKYLKEQLAENQSETPSAESTQRKP